MFQDPYASLDPRMRVGTILASRSQSRASATTAEQRARCASSSRSRPQPPAPALLPARVLRRAAPAHRLRPGAHAQPAPDRRRRAGLGARRLDPVADPQPDAGAPAAPRAHLRRHLARPRGRPVHLRPIGVMYLGKLVEIGPRRSLRAPGAPLHRGLIDTIPVPGPRLAAPRGAAHRGRAALRAHPPRAAGSGPAARVRQEICAEEEPPLRSFGGDHLAACHFPLQRPVAMAAATASGATPDS